MKTVAYHTLGCKLNFSETSSIARGLEKEGFTKIEFSASADLYVINTCSVTNNADKECKTIVRKAKRLSPDSKVVIIGCYAQLKPKEISEIPGVDLVLGASEKFNITKFLEELEENGSSVHSCEINDVDFFVDAYSFGDRTRAFLKVQDGCDYGCTFCTIPLARGRSRSDLIENVIKNAKEIGEKGIKEIVLTGVNIGDFGKGNSGARKSSEAFIDLVKALDEVEEVDRFRISSIEPNLLTDEIIEFVAQSKRFMPHFHIPLQSGNDVMLKKMKRRYLTKLYTDRVAKIKALMPHCCIGVDVIIGFPGETNEHFFHTYNYLNELDISYLHVFTYSERANTKAALMPGVVPKKERAQRSKMLRVLSEKKRRFFYEQYQSAERFALLEGKEAEGIMHGFTDNYVKIEMPYRDELVNSIQKVRLGEVLSTGNVEVECLVNA
jgi:threonylcarbamoyladenosine tRNA methylthiotransferase MtaB